MINCDIKIFSYGLSHLSLVTIVLNKHINKMNFQLIKKKPSQGSQGKKRKIRNVGFEPKAILFTKKIKKRILSSILHILTCLRLPASILLFSLLNQCFLSFYPPFNTLWSHSNHHEWLKNRFPYKKVTSNSLIWIVIR